MIITIINDIIKLFKIGSYNSFLLIANSNQLCTKGKIRKNDIEKTKLKSIFILALRSTDSVQPDQPVFGILPSQSRTVTFFRGHRELLAVL